jgi:hypothetical protein
VILVVIADPGRVAVDALRPPGGDILGMLGTAREILCRYGQRRDGQLIEATMRALLEGHGCAPGASLATLTRSSEGDGAALLATLVGAAPMPDVLAEKLTRMVERRQTPVLIGLAGRGDGGGFRWPTPLALAFCAPEARP